MHPSRFLAFFTLLLLAASFAAPAQAESPSDEARLLRFPDIHRDFVVFVHAGDLWRVAVEGGIARRLTAHEGLELFPKISPDGEWIAFTAEYTGSRQVFVMPAEGGASRQLTFYNDVGAMPPRGGWDNWILDWTREGKILVRMNRTPWGVRMGRYFLVDPEGGLETPLALPEGGSASPSPDGNKLAYCPVSREFRTWKRTRGGRAQDIWIYDFTANRSTRLTDSPATENFPMWSEKTIYFTSDAEYTLNLYAVDAAGGETRRLTEFDEFDVLWPSLGPEAIVFMNGGYLYRFGLDDERAERIPVQIDTEMPLTVTHFKQVEEFIDGATLSPSGARAAFSARGELFTVPAKEGPTRNLSHSPGSREIAPAWSPDGDWIAYLSDATGEYEVYVRPQDGSGEARQLTEDGHRWRFPPIWSPDSTQIAFGDRDRRLMILRVEDGALTEIDRGEHGDLTQYSWSPDSRWLVYERSHPSRLVGVALYSLDQQHGFLLGDGMTRDHDPVFSADGKYLFFLSDRDFNLTFSSFEFNYVYRRSARVYAAALDPEAPALFPPKSDEEEGTAEDENGDPDDSDADQDDEQPEEDEPLRVEPDGWVLRTLAIPGLASGNYSDLSANDEALFYVRREDGDPSTLYRYDLEEREEKAVIEPVSGYELSFDGKKLLYVSGGNWGIVDAKPGQTSGDGKLDLAGLEIKLDPRAEWSQIFEDTWRIARDWFYDTEMHGKDWEELGRRYRELVPSVAHRADLDFILGELVSELDAGHTYVQTGDEPSVRRVEGGMLGCELEPHRSGHYRISKIYAGENWDSSYRSPLTEPGVGIHEGDFLLSIDGIDVPTSDNPYRLLENKAGKQVVLTVAPQPSSDDARDVTVVPVSSEGNLRYLDWVRSRMALTDSLSDGRVGYIHLPDTASAGNRMLQKLFYSQVDKPALIIDDRYNGGGFIPDRMIEYFGRRTIVYWDRRDIESMRTPNFAHDGPKAMLINGYSSSGGDALPYFFKDAGLGPLIGTRTWGGLIGLTGNPALVDGGTVLIPSFRLYDTEGNWAVENEGVSPDIEVLDLPELRLAGGDPSLEKAVELLLERLKENPHSHPAAPEPPDMGR